MTSPAPYEPRPDAPHWVACCCCARTYAETSAGHAPFCAADLVAGTVSVNFGSRFATGAVFVARLPSDLDLADGVVCDLCLEAMIDSGLVFQA